MNKCFVDYRISKEEISNLSLENLDIIKVLPSKNLYKAIDGHPDIQLNILSNNTLIAHEELFNNLKSYPSLNKFNLNLVKAKTNLKNTYPYDISLNAVNLKDFFIHNLKYTDECLLNSVKEKNLINVKQGYTKCSCAVISNNAIITSDVGIYNELKKYPIDVLGISTKDISLPYLNYGFIGGTCGLLCENKIAFFGNYNLHPYGKEIEKFLIKHDVKPIFLSKKPLVDRGSILTLF